MPSPNFRPANHRIGLGHGRQSPTNIRVQLLSIPTRTSRTLARNRVDCKLPKGNLRSCPHSRHRAKLHLHVGKAINPTAGSLNLGLDSVKEDTTQLRNGSSISDTHKESAPAADAGVPDMSNENALTADASPSTTETKPSKGNLFKRVLVGVALGLFGGFVILTGQKLFLTMTILVVYQATQEYYGFITSKGISKGMTPPPRFVSVAITILCMSIAVSTFLFKGRSGTSLACAAVLVLSLELLDLEFFGVPVKWTVGLAATFTSVACIIASDTGAYFVGKTLGRTKLTDISPKKTVEGAVGGLLSSVAVALALWKVVQWPTSPIAAIGLGILVFFSSLFGDLIESIMKRDAGLKDSGTLFPGHGGLLDRFDSYIFTGAVTYFWVTIAVPSLGL